MAVLVSLPRYLAATPTERHLSRKLLAHLRSLKDIGQRQAHLDFTLELYTFFAITSKVTPSIEDRTRRKDLCLVHPTTVALTPSISQSAHDLGVAKAGLEIKIEHFSNGSQNCSSHELATRLFQQALLIFLRTSFHGLRTPDQTLRSNCPLRR